MSRLLHVAVLLAMGSPAFDAGAQVTGVQVTGVQVTGVQVTGGERPAALPTRDVDVTYQSEQAGQVFEQRSRFDVATKRLRLDTPTRGLYMIVDYEAKRMSMVTEADHGVLELPAPATGVPGQIVPGAPGQTFVRRGAQQIAGNACTEWETKDNQNQPVLTCFTEDGVLLGARRGATVLAVATQVTYGTMNAALFEIPSGYRHIEKRAP